jgi:surface antigen/LysM repeat protein
MRKGISILGNHKRGARVRIERLSHLPAAPASKKPLSMRQLCVSVLATAATGIRAASLDSVFAYPATRLAKLPWQKLVLRFADECLLVVLGIMLVGFNIFVSFSNGAAQDTSLFATALSRHGSKNTALYSKLFATTTTVTPNGLIPEARADEQIGDSATTQVAGISEGVSALTSIDAQGLSAATIPDIQSLLDSQIQVYETQAGDTLASIAERHGIDVPTIKWSNNLDPNSDTIKPGWFLVIPPVKGVLVKADEDTSIAGIASKFKCTEERIISFNGLEGADSVEEGKYIMCPDGVVPAPPKPVVAAPIAKAATRTIGISYKSIPDLPGTTNSFVKGNCTWYVAKLMKITFRGNANRWLANAPKAGYKTGKVPMAGSAVVTTLGGKYGHVGFVKSVNPDGTFVMTDMNYEGLYKVRENVTMSADEVVGFIYPID